MGNGRLSRTDMGYGVLKEARQRQIVELLRTGEVVNVADLARRFETSLITIRRDLSALHASGLISRTHGGAVPARHDTFTDSPYRERRNVHDAAKRRAVTAAAALIRNGDSLYMNAGTTMCCLVEALRDRTDLNVVTNGITVSYELSRLESVDVFLLAGMVDFNSMSTVGPAAEESLRDIRIARAFLGVSGLSVEGGMAMFDVLNARINRAIVHAAEEVVVVVDASKFRSQAHHRIAPLTDIDVVVTDDGVSADDVDRMRSLGIEVIIAGP